MERPITETDRSEAIEAWLSDELQAVSRRIEDVCGSAADSDIGEPEVYYRLGEAVRHLEIAGERLQRN